VSFRVLGVGEVLWDLLPSGAQLGGAPANFACHASALGADAAIVTRVGEDPLGGEILERLAANGLPGGLIQADERAPTGTVTVELEPGGAPRFTIHEGVAWDGLLATDEALCAATRADAVCFGSLAQRCEPARGSVRRLVAATRADALRIFDVNLRQSFYSRETLDESLRLASVLKLNDGELPVLASVYGLGGTLDEQLDALAARFELRLVALTRGDHGSRLRGPAGSSDHPGVEAAVRDTVGAGDAFTAALAMGLLLGWPLDRINARANDVAAFVCSCAGATPPLPRRLTLAFEGR
jgi:fructokinase